MDVLAAVFAIVLILVIATSVVAFLRTVKPRRVTVYAWQRAARFRHGALVRILDPGRYFVTSGNEIQVLDTRLQSLQVPGQEVLTPEGLSLKITLTGEFRIVDPERYLLTSAQPTASLYNDAQQALREAIGTASFEAILADRTAIKVRDIMLPGELKRAYAQAVTAQREGQAALERARAETASLRSLANAARLMQDHPGLLQLRALQAVEAGKGNTLTLTLDAEPSTAAGGGRTPTPLPPTPPTA